jgi:hypothetical protein
MYNPRRTVPSIGKESTYGTAASSLSKFWGLMQPLQPNDDYDFAEKEGIRDDIEIQGNEIMVQRHSFDIQIDWLANGQILEYVFGTNSESGSGDITHTILPLNNSYHDSFTLEVAEKGTTNDVNTYLGCTIDEFTLSWNKGEQVKATASIVAQDVDNGTTISGTSSEPASQEYFDWSHVKLSVNGSTVENESGSLTVSKNLESEPRVTDAPGTKLIARPSNGSMKYNLTFARKKLDAVIGTAWRTGSDNTLVLLLQISATYYIQFTFTGVKFKTNQTDIDTGNTTNMENVTAVPTACAVEVVDQSNW